MPIPLYSGHFVPPPGGNAGLRYAKFFDEWTDRNFTGIRAPGKSHDGAKIPGGKQAWVQKFAKSRVGDKELLEEHVRRQMAMVAALGGELIEAKTEWRFVSGLGNAHPIENGFAWHHSLGVPYLPGPGVKGVVKDWIERWSEPPAKDPSPGEVLGSPQGVGTVSFMDALPTELVQLTADGITPHHKEYYSKAVLPPADWDDPDPIPFLSVAPGEKFLFAVVPRRKRDASHAKVAAKWLREALTEIGAGAKSNVGYGRFQLPGKK